MDNKNIYIYCDSCVFIHYISKTPEHINTLDSLFEYVKKGEYPKIITSTISITEVAFAHQEKLGHKLDPDILGKMDNIWNDHSILELVEYNPFIARMARQMLREKLGNNGKNSKFTPNDAIHLATYSFFERNGLTVKEFFTYDDPVINEMAPFFHIHACNPIVEQEELLNFTYPS